jgi:hypothetical protein
MRTTKINVNVERLPSTDEKQSNRPLSPEAKGTVDIEGDYATLRYERRLSHPRAAC